MTSRLLIETPLPGLTELPPGYDLGLDIFIRSGIAWSLKPWEMGMIPVLMAHQACISFETANTPSRPSHSTGGDQSERTSPKKPHQRSHAKKTTTPSTTSDTSLLLWEIAFLRYQITKGILTLSADSWRSILSESWQKQPQTPPPEVIVPAGSQLPPDWGVQREA